MGEHPHTSKSQQRSGRFPRWLNRFEADRIEPAALRDRCENCRSSQDKGRLAHREDCDRVEPKQDLVNNDGQDTHAGSGKDATPVLSEEEGSVMVAFRGPTPT